MTTFSMTDTGVLREMNQDYFFASDVPVGNLPNLYIVADGMGGHRAGEYASRYTIERVVASVSRSPGAEPIIVLKDAIRKANELLIREAAEDTDKKGMGTTLVIATIYGDHMYVANIGDSRLYIVNSGITQITKDHSLVEEMVRIGEMDESQAWEHPDKNIITRAIGATPEVEADFFEVDLTPEDTILMCSDGLTNMIRDEDIMEIINSEKTVETQVRTLIETANSNGGKDNITVVMIKPFCDEVKKC